uniref:Uncharacterized protein n=1 Tax=Zea mays TaxID=4577 RepID=A0A804Q385_MAIZE
MTLDPEKLVMICPFYRWEGSGRSSISTLLYPPGTTSTRTASRACTTRHLKNHSWISTQLKAYRNHVLGNHDYRGNALAQLSPVLRKIDDRFICMRSFIVNASITEKQLVDFFFVDTTPFQLEYWTHPGKHRYDWRGVAPR